MSHAAAKHPVLDAELAEALARDGGNRRAGAKIVPGHGEKFPANGGGFCASGDTLLPNRLRSKDLRSMNDQRAAKVLFARLIECTSSRGNRYMRGWAGASNLIAFPGEADEQGRPPWKLYLAERTPKPGTVTGNLRERQERVSAAVASGVDLDDSIPF
jgi:hypothetical protein